MTIVSNPQSDAEVICVDDDEVEALDPEAPASAKHKEIAKLYNEEEFALFSRISKRKPWTTPHIPGYRWYVRVLSSTVLSVVLLKVDDVEAPPAHEIFLKPILAKANYVHPDGECSVELSKVITRGQTISAKRFMEIIEKNPIEVRADVRWHTYTGLHGKEETILCLGSLGTFMWVCHVLETLDDCCGYPYDLLENRTHNAVRVETAMGFYMDLHNIGRKEDGENDKQGTQNTGNNEDADNTGNNEDRHNTGKNDDGHNSGAQEDAAPGGDDTEAATPKPAGISIASLPPEILTNHKVVGILMSLDGKMIRGVVCRSDADIFHGSLHSIDCYMKIPRGSRQGLPKCQACYEYYRKILRSRPRCKAKEAGGDVPNKSKAHTQLSRSEMLGRLTVMSRQIRNMQKKLRYIETEMKGKRARDEESEDDDEEEDGSDANKKSRGKSLAQICVAYVEKVFFPFFSCLILSFSPWQKYGHLLPFFLFFLIIHISWKLCKNGDNATTLHIRLADYRV